ncbi:DapH/DapD/GlmU-related protein [uncultured Algibacter sp.]|uniref:DapH/DapD/GlmU-related protein n=1 Tax=uncultured Algibacter sp. TaxID=298659 RepID=UPI00262EB6E0|nr:DapH/DapD/GlmU-related protein [uncultured Algibacter sp.]
MIQLKFLSQDVLRLIGKRKVRYLYFVFTRGFAGVLLYRMERLCYLIFKDLYPGIRLLFLPLILLLQSYSNIDIHYKANIAGGLLVLHPSVGCVISGQVKIGSNLTITGGNVIGVNKTKKGVYSIGNHCTLGANATIIGPLSIEDRVTVGANACVTKSFNQSHIILAGVPAKELKS